MIRFAVKAGLVGGAAYYASEMGVWKDNETTSKLYCELRQTASPHLKKIEETLPFELPALPKTDNLSQLAVHYWNCGVKTTFRFLVGLPERAVGWSKSAYNAAMEFANTPPPTSPPAEDAK